MQSLINFFPILLGREFGINTDIFETNIINIVILCVGLFNFVGGILKTSMAERKQKILESVQSGTSPCQTSSRQQWLSAIEPCNG